MFPWVDLLLGLVIVWEGLAGLIYGFKSAIIRLGILAGALAISLPFAANSSHYLMPVLEPVFQTAIQEKAIAVSTGQANHQFLGPWQDVVRVTASTGMDVIAERVLSLALNVSGLIFLVTILVVAHRLVETRRLSRNLDQLGAVAGLISGIFAVLVVLAIAPILALAEKGGVLMAALEGSLGVKAFALLVQGLVNRIAPFVY